MKNINKKYTNEVIKWKKKKILYKNFFIYIKQKKEEANNSGAHNQIIKLR